MAMIDRRLFALLIVTAMLLPGCLSGETTKDVTDDDGHDHEHGDEPEPEPPGPVSVPNTPGCDNLNPIHCMLPFPSDAFLIPDASTETGWRVNYANTTLPESGSMDNVNIPSINRLDGMSPSTQIMTAFSTIPNLTGVADQHTIASSLEDGHATILLNLDTGARVPHWVEIDARADDVTKTIVYIRTIGPLDPNTAYGIGMSGMDVEPSAAFQAILDGNVTNAQDIEARRNSMDDLLAVLISEGHETDLVAAWMFRTASLNSTLGGILSMRTDALTRLGDDGIGCTVTSVETDWLDDTDNDFRLIKGTYTVPQYLEWQNPPSLMSRDDAGMPVFVENAEIPFTMMIPNSLAEANRSGPLTIFGHGFLGQGEYYAENLVHGWAEAYEVPFIATDILGWSYSDVDTIALGLFDPGYFEHQSDRLQQMLINHLALARTFKGVCSDLSEFSNNGTNLVDSSDIAYMGYSLGGIYGASITAFSPDIDRGVLWVGGSGFSTFIERSTNYATFGDGFALDSAYPERNDRAILISLCQQMWDPSDPEVWLRFTEGGMDGEITPFRVLSIISINDAQVPKLSSDRAARTAGMTVLNHSMYHPYGLETADGPFTEGSVVVYWDGGYAAMPDTNAPPPIGDAGKAHNEIGPILQVNEMIEEFLLDGIITDTCDGGCTFDYEEDRVDF